jgi:hypothetical protein
MSIMTLADGTSVLTFNIDGGGAASWADQCTSFQPTDGRTEIALDPTLAAFRKSDARGSWDGKIEVKLRPDGAHALLWASAVKTSSTIVAIFKATSAATSTANPELTVTFQPKTLPSFAGAIDSVVMIEETNQVQALSVDWGAGAVTYP